jgi:hypothetical protein
VAGAARDLLDSLFWRAALGSLNLRRSVPFRRQFDRTLNGRLDLHSAPAYLRVWCGDPGGRLAPDTPAPPRLHEMLIAAATPYRPPAAALRAARRQGAWGKRSWLLRLGHGHGNSPEIHAAGPGYLLSAGGSARPGVPPVRTRPTTLLLADDGARRLRDCFHIPGTGPRLRWNNTGVHRGFAVGTAPVRVPEGRAPAARRGTWRLFVHEEARRPVWIAVHQGRNHPEGAFGLLVVTAAKDHEEPERWLSRLREANPEPAALRRRFRRPGGPLLRYDLGAPRHQWVIRSVDGDPAPRRFDRWPLWPQRRRAALRRVRGGASGPGETEAARP